MSADCGQSREPAPRVAAGGRRHRRVLLRDLLSPPRDGDEPGDVWSTASATGPTRRACRAPISTSPSRGLAQRLLGHGAGPARDRPGTSRCAGGRLADGSEPSRRSGGSRSSSRPAPRADDPGEADVIAVCMATYEPDIELFRVQVESLRAQTDALGLRDLRRRLGPERFAALRRCSRRRALRRLALGRRLGFYRNFERALRLAPAEARLLALCDQDDRWHPEKLAVLRAALGGAPARLLRPAARRRRRARAARDAVARPAQQPHRPGLDAGRRTAITGAAIADAPRGGRARAAVPRHAGPAVPRPLARARRARRRRHRLRRSPALRLRPARGSGVRRGQRRAGAAAAARPAARRARGLLPRLHLPRGSMAETLLRAPARLHQSAGRQAGGRLARPRRAAERLHGGRCRR